MKPETKQFYQVEVEFNPTPELLQAVEKLTEELTDYKAKKVKRIIKNAFLQADFIKYSKSAPHLNYQIVNQVIGSKLSIAFSSLIELTSHQYQRAEVVKIIAELEGCYDF